MRAVAHPEDRDVDRAGHGDLGDDGAAGDPPSPAATITSSPSGSPSTAISRPHGSTREQSPIPAGAGVALDGPAGTAARGSMAAIATVAKASV